MDEITMKSHARRLSVVIISAPILPLLGVVAYDMVVFSPRLDDIRAILVNADLLDRCPPANIHHYIHALHQRSAGPSAIVAMRLHSRFLPRVTEFGSRMGELMWEKLLWLHLSQDEVIALYSTLAYTGQGAGLSALSQRMFAKPLSALTDREAATLVAYTGSPAWYLHHPERLAARRDALMERARNRH
ncbi:transglycosylase domain-containing protein [Xanthomonas euvesicatoria]|uniref:transglycosylase domain-containing protein n=1 Tax=Xanthomonas euvesicatoria TaxID=456327 RepID=UPI0024063FB3|nr:transglycosylase domain-containing protein [Xanthomonas euvesicatoria]MCP3041693.1 transglycosylase domain-containing protein [Xanthomonas euvesicatoria pv. allii]